MSSAQIARDTAAIYADPAITVAASWTAGGVVTRCRGTFGVAEVLEDDGGVQVGVRRPVLCVPTGALGNPPVDTLVTVDGRRYRLAALSMRADGAEQVAVLVTVSA